MNRLYTEDARKKPVFDIHTIDIPDDEVGVILQLISDLYDDPSIEAIYLYGSYARSEQKPYSDIDIAVITGSSTPTRKEREHIGSYSSKKCDIQVFSDLPLPAQMQVLSQGVPLMCKHPDYMRKLIRSVSLTYMDQEPMRDRFRRRIL
ncbi:MAG: nucleotidyltransferase domain-containing protein [Methanobacteriota archaeon]